MSVINRMLKDLDERKDRPAAEQYTPAAIAPEPVRWALWGSLAAVVVVITAGSWWWLAGAEPVQQNTTQVDKPQPADVQQKVEQKAEQRVEQKADQVVVTADQAVAQQQQTHVDTVVQDTAGVDQPQLDERQDPQVDAPKPELVERQQPEQPQLDQNLEQQKLELAQVEQAKVEQPKAEQPKAEQPKADSSFAIERVQLSPSELADSNLAKARAAFRQGEREKAQELLEKALMVMPEHVAVRSELAAYWYGRGMTTRALSLLRQGLDLRPQQSQWQLLYARILERNGRIQDTYDALVNVQADTEDAAELLQLRASSANQLGLFAEAAADYTELALQLKQGRWWIAAAVAYEDASNINAALQAYRQALAFTDLNADALSYAQQRIRALGGQ